MRWTSSRLNDYMTLATLLNANASYHILIVKDLHVSYPNRDGVLVVVVRGVSFTLGASAWG